MFQVEKHSHVVILLSKIVEYMFLHITEHLEPVDNRMQRYLGKESARFARMSSSSESWKSCSEEIKIFTG